MAEETDVFAMVDGVEVNVSQLQRVINKLSDNYRKSKAECTALSIELKKSNRLIRKYKATCEVKQKYINRFVSIFGKNWKRAKPITAHVIVTIPSNVQLKVIRNGR